MRSVTEPRVEHIFPTAQASADWTLGQCHLYLNGADLVKLRETYDTPLFVFERQLPPIQGCICQSLSEDRRLLP